MDPTYGGEGGQKSEVKLDRSWEWKEEGTRTGLVIRTICSWVQIFQGRLELGGEMEGV